MRIIITGSRDWFDPHMVRDWLNEVADQFGPPLERIIIVHGDQRGLDHIGGALAKRRGFTVEPVAADWKLYGNSAGPIRNAEMLKRGADAVVAFKDDFAHYGLDFGGTENMVKIALRAGLPCELINHTERRML